MSFMNTDHVGIENVTYFVLHVIYNRPKREQPPRDRYEMLYVGKGEKKRSHLQNHCRQIKSP